MEENNSQTRLPDGQVVIYQTESGETKLDVTFNDETVWLTQLQMCELFDKSKAIISEHIKNIFEEGELQENVVVRKFRTTTQHGAIAGKTQSREDKIYNLDVIISVGYRVKSKQGTQFKIWATQRLKEYIIKGFTLNDDRFRKGNSMNYFNELQERNSSNNSISHVKNVEALSEDNIFVIPKGIDLFSTKPYGSVITYPFEEK